MHSAHAHSADSAHSAHAQCTLDTVQPTDRLSNAISNQRRAAVTENLLKLQQLTAVYTHMHAHVNCTHTYTQSFLTCLFFPELLQVRPVPKTKLLKAVVAEFLQARSPS